jgi:hypothetical protein
MMTVLGVVAAIFGVAYFLPTIVACMRGTKGKTWIFILNLFFGLSGLGYLMAWVWAMGPTHAELRAAAERERLSEEADRAVIEMERRTRAALEYRQEPTLGSHW